MVSRPEDERGSSYDEYAGLSAEQQKKRCGLIVDRARMPPDPRARICSLHHTAEKTRTTKAVVRATCFGGVAQTSLFEICDAPKGHFKERRSAVSSMPDKSLRETGPQKPGVCASPLHERWSALAPYAYVNFRLLRCPQLVQNKA